MNYPFIIKKILSKDKKISNHYFQILCDDELIKKYINSLSFMNEDKHAICLVSLWQATFKYNSKKGTFPTYFYRIAKQDITDQYRKDQAKKNIRTISIEEEGVKIIVDNIADNIDNIGNNGNIGNNAQNNNPINNIIKNEEELILYNNLNKILTPLERDSVWSRAICNESHKEIASDMGKKVKTISDALFRGRQKLIKIIDKN